jgi:ribosomal-protein-alanine N-acetyltransferase
MDLTARVGVQPSLKTSRLSLTPFVAGDARAVFAYASNPNVSRYTTWKTHTSVSDAERFLRWVQGRKSDFCWAIRPIPSDVAKGAIEFGLEDATKGAVHFVLAEDLWNQGFMTEAVDAVVGWAFGAVDGLERVATVALSANRGSCRVLEKCGFRFDGLVQEKWDKFEDPVELATYSLTRSRWQGLGRDQAGTDSA